jgi:alpha-amylase
VAPRISLALAIHNHQPVGNFGWVFAEVYERAYEPLLAGLERHPGVRLSLHYTGALLEWLDAERPGFLERLRALVDRDQVELMGGGLYEPVLASLPDRDRLAQLVRMADRLEALTGRRPRGAWLAERVWEPDLPASLVGAGYHWTILDDAHFRAAAVPEEQLWGAYATEDQGHPLIVFGTEQGLRYRIPFGPVEGVIDHLRAHATEAGDRLGTMGDDGEKFGAWPTTWEHCWGEGRWVDRFFEALEANASWLTTVTPSAWLAGQPPIGRVYVPTGSYAEMGEWALPAEEALAFHDARERALVEDRAEARWLRGGFWRNFQVKYREVNDLHKQMLRASAKVASMAPGEVRDLAVDHLHRGQSNDCYWHGLFGGIYISHMRLATLEHLIAAEDLADQGAGLTEHAALTDTDLDGIDEVLVHHPGQVVTIDLAEGGGIGGWDIRAVRHALTGVLRRRPEWYHERLRRHDAAQARAAMNGGSAGGVASIHEIVQVKEPGLAERLQFDAYERRSGLVRFLADDETPERWSAGEALERGEALDGAWVATAVEPARVVVEHDGTVRMGRARHRVRIVKRLTVGGTRARPRLVLDVEVENRSRSPLGGRLGIEWALTMLGGGGNPAAWWEVAGERTAHDGVGVAAGVDRLAQGNDDIGLRVVTSVDPGADAWWAPIDTISNSEAGFERVYQGAGLLLSWPLTLAPGARLAVRVRHDVTTARDRAREDARGSDA